MTADRVMEIAREKAATMAPHVALALDIVTGLIEYAVSQAIGEVRIDSPGVNRIDDRKEGGAVTFDHRTADDSEG